VLVAGRGDAQLALCLDEALPPCGPLISEGIHYGIDIALTSVDSHYIGVDFDAVGQGYALEKSDSDILAIGSATSRGAEVLAGKMFATCIHHQYQISGV